MLAPAVARLLSVISVGMVFAFFRILLGWLDRRTGDSIMRERINKGSDRYFVDEEKHWGESEIDSIVHGRFDNA
jgi:hypothetical protein